MMDRVLDSHGDEPDYDVMTDDDVDDMMDRILGD